MNLYRLCLKLDEKIFFSMQKKRIDIKINISFFCNYNFLKTHFLGIG